MSMWRGHAIEVEGLRKTYDGDVEAVKDIDFDVADGEVFGLLGPNGAGKSTTIGMLTTTITPTAGTARLVGHDVRSDPIGARRVSAVVFQEAVVDRALTGRVNLVMHAQLWGVDTSDAQHAIDQHSEAFGLSDLLDRPVSSYSGGQRRRLEIARALISEPDVLFLDEPTVGLDPRIRYELLDVIAGLRASAGTTILLTTHYLDEAERLCDRIAIVHAGRIAALDTPSALLTRLGSELVELKVDDRGERVLAALRASELDVEDAFVVGSTLTIPLLERPARNVMEVLDADPDARAHVTAVTTRPPTLDDVYLQLTGASLAA